MDRKSIIVLVVSFVLLILWYPLVSRWYGPQPGAHGTNAVVGATNSAVQGTNLPPGPAASAPTPPGASSGTLVKTDAPEQTLVLENENALYTFTSHGGGLKRVDMKNYPESVNCRRRDASPTRKLATLNTRAPVPTFALLGDETLQGDAEFTLSRTANGMRAEKTLPIGVRLVKEIQPGTNYLLSVVLRYQNITNHPVRLPAQEWVVGTATPIGPTDNGALMASEWYDGAKPQSVAAPWFDNRTLGCFPGTPRSEYLAGNSNVVWAAVQNRFFTMIAVPPTNVPAPQLVVRRVPLAPPAPEEIADNPKAVTNQVGLQTAFLYPDLGLAPGQTVERRFDVFAGPKEYKTLDRLAATLGNTVDLVMGFGGFFGFFARLLLLSMNGLHALGLSYGVTIVAITVIIKLVFWPLTQASTRSMKRMQALQPQVKALQEK